MHHVIESKMCANLNSFSPAITFTANYLKTVFSHLCSPLQKQKLQLLLQHSAVLSPIYRYKLIMVKLMSSFFLLGKPTRQRKNCQNCSKQSKRSIHSILIQKALATGHRDAEIVVQAHHWIDLGPQCHITYITFKCHITNITFQSQHGNSQKSYSNSYRSFKLARLASHFRFIY